MYQRTFPGGSPYNSPFVGPLDFTVHVPLDVSALTNTLVDQKGKLKPGAVLTPAGTPPDGTEGETAVLNLETIRVAEGNSTAALEAAADRTIACLAIGIAKRAVLEENLGRELSANELAALKAGGITLI